MAEELRDMAFTVTPLKFSQTDRVLTVERTLRTTGRDGFAAIADMVREVEKGRGFLLGGVRGCGKTSLLNEVSFHFNRQVDNVVALGPLSLGLVAQNGLNSLGSQLSDWLRDNETRLPYTLPSSYQPTHAHSLDAWLPFLNKLINQRNADTLLLLLDDLDSVPLEDREVILQDIQNSSWAKIATRTMLGCAGKLLEDEISLIPGDEPYASGRTGSQDAVVAVILKRETVVDLLNALIVNLGGSPPAIPPPPYNTSFEPAEAVDSDKGIELVGDVAELVSFPYPSFEAEGPLPGSPQAPTTTTADPPRTAYAVLNCPDSVVAQQEFTLVVGLGKEQSANVFSGPMERPASSVGPYKLTIQVVADRFILRTGESWRREVMVTAEAPYPTVDFRLTPEPQQENLQPRIIQAMYSVDGQTMGVAFRPITVVKQADLLDALSAKPAEPGIDFSIPTDRTAPDLTLRILQDVDRQGGLLWTFESPHQGLDLPDEPIKTNIGSDPQGFTRILIQKVNAREGKPGLYSFLRGIGQHIAEKMPQEFWRLLRAVATRSNGTLMVLLLSEEPYVPWELAWVDEPLLDPNAPPFLSAQLSLGRWVLGQQRPKLPPPAAVQVKQVAVVSGVYNKPGWQRLIAAEEEAQQLGTNLKAVSINAVLPDVLDCIGGNPQAEVLHFAVHGIYDPQGVQNGLVLVDGAFLDPFEVKGTPMDDHTPFVFLNACQVGAGSEILGDYAGMAEAFLSAGASSVIAPLWSIKDTVAKDMALRFYTEMQNKKQVAPADFLRQERRAFQPTKGASGTYLAYQFFGHPAFKLHYVQ